MKIRERRGDYDAPLRSHRGRVGLSRMYCIIHSMYSTNNTIIYQPLVFHFPHGFYKSIVCEVLRAIGK
jgi:hypothetical protein